MREENAPGARDRAQEYDEPRRGPERQSDRRAEFRVADDQRSGQGVMTAWSRMSMIERRKRMWRQVRGSADR